MPMTLGMVVSSFFSGQLVSRIGKYKIVLLAGAATLFVGYLLMQGLTADTTRIQVTWRMIILGIGLGPALPLYTLAVQNSVNPREIGAATSSSQFFRSVGSTIGVAVFGTVLVSVLAAQLPKYMPPGVEDAKMAGLRFSMGALESGNIESVGDKIRARMGTTYDKIEAALARNDSGALKSLLDDPFLPNPYKTDIQARAASTSKAPTVPIDPRTRMLLANIRTSMENLAVALTDQIGTALRKAFTEAVRRVYFWGLFVIASGLILTLFLPEIALRNTPGNVDVVRGEAMGPAPNNVPPQGKTAGVSTAVPER
jgi:hypothetical protein